ncbi:MAG TPA: hypothetical protein DCF63_21010 [Planctomycetaceae bacterium]|nr:hypothetical protein [Planctomycetaceae bacterium]
MLHGEQMINLSTPIGWLSDSEKSMLKNSSDIPLKSVLLLRQNSKGGYESAWLGELVAGQQTNVVWNPQTMNEALQPWNDQLLTQAEKPTAKQLQATDGRWVGRLLDQIARGVPLTPGQAVMIGYTDKRLGAIDIQPSQDQYDGICVLVAHLSPPAMRPIQPDVNILSQQRLPQEPENDSDQNLPSVKTPAQLP